MKSFMNKRQLFFILIFASMALFSGCKSTRKAIKQPIKEYGADYLFEKLKENELKFDWLSGKFSLDLIIDKKKNSFKGQIRIRRDSAIWVSFSPALGIEMARMLITQDSVFFLNRISKNYFAGDIEFVTGFLDANVDFDVIQSLLIGNDLTYYENGKFRATYDSKEYHLVTSGRRKLKKHIKTNDDAQRIYLQNIYLNPETYKISRMKIKDVAKENQKLEAFYSGNEPINGQLFPMQILYNISANSQIEVSMNYSKIVLDQTLKLPFKIPSKYERIE
ncbi:MAG: hypothetical protein DRJ05_08535 [Bacteroidetes bacterium]|nr:MAG: hypothetical protein DRJ05_08535 [Bacteroidota bacterium]